MKVSKKEVLKDLEKKIKEESNITKKKQLLRAFKRLVNMKLKKLLKKAKRTKKELKKIQKEREKKYKKLVKLLTKKKGNGIIFSWS